MVICFFIIGVSQGNAAGVYRVGDQGEEIAELQGKLAVLGYDVMADGAFGPAMVDAIKEKKKGIKNTSKLEREAIESLDKMCDEGKTSMLQDILAGRKTEVDIFSGEVIRLGKLFGISTPYNKVLYDLIKIKEEKNEHSIHTC